MNTEAMNVLKKLREAKKLVEQLELKYRGICDCNERLPNVEHTHQEALSGSYTKTHKTCAYHTYKTYKDVRYASL
jgi:uncharacterized lipoprotein YehR (DUF1307 family)